MVVRGGYGVYYNTSVYNMIAANMAQQPPFAQVLNVSTYAWLNPLLHRQRIRCCRRTRRFDSTYAIDPYYRIGYAQTWTHLRAARSAVRHVRHRWISGHERDAARPAVSAEFRRARDAPLDLLPQGFIYQMSNGNSTYHAAQFQLNRRFRSGLGWGASYQFSKSIDNAGTGGRGQGGTPVAQNWLDYSAERGLSSFDSRHNISVQATVQHGHGYAPAARCCKGWKGALLKDWTSARCLRCAPAIRSRR